MSWSHKGQRRKMKPDPKLLERTTKIHELWRIYEERAEGVLEKRTLDRRWKAIKYFVSETKVDDVRMINFDRLVEFKNAKLRQGTSATTINSYLASIRSFLQYLGIEVEVPYLGAPEEREAKIIKCLLTPQEIEKLLEVIPNLKYKAAVSLLSEVAMRVGVYSERAGYGRRGLLGLNWGDIDFQNGTVTIIGKGGKTYVRPLGELSEKYLRELKETGNMGKIGKNDPVFVSYHGTRLTYHGFYLTLRKYMKRAGIPEEKRHPHAFRHTKGTWVTKKYGIRAAKGVLCHENLASTLIYEHIVDQDYLMELFRPDKVREAANEEVKMKVCPDCGAELTPDRKLCICGYDFALHRCPQCGRSVNKDTKFCPYCGTRIGIPRPDCVCGHELKIDFKVCPNCGRPTDGVKKLWDEKNLEKWSSYHRGKSEAPFETFRDKRNHSIEFSNSSDEANSVDSDSKSDHDRRANNNEPTIPNFKHYEVRIVSTKEQLVKLLEEDWELVKELSTNEFVMRKRNNGHNDSLKR